MLFRNSGASDPLNSITKSELLYFGIVLIFLIRAPNNLNLSPKMSLKTFSVNMAIRIIIATINYYSKLFRNMTFFISIGKNISIANGQAVLCIEIEYADHDATRIYMNDSNEILLARNYSIKYDLKDHSAYMKSTSGQYIKMEREIVGEKFYRHNNSVLNLIVPCKKRIMKRKYGIFNNVGTIKPKRERRGKKDDVITKNSSSQFIPEMESPVNLHNG